jgi:hypothetical protein
MWVQDGCKVYMDSYMTLDGSCFHGHLDCFQKSSLGGKLNTKLKDHVTPNAHNCWFIWFYDVWGPACMDIHPNSIWLRAQSHMTSHYTWGSVSTLHDFGGVLGQPLDTFFVGSHNFMVTALGLCEATLLWAKEITLLLSKMLQRIELFLLIKVMSYFRAHSTWATTAG